MPIRRAIPDADDWQPIAEGKGTCFHRALNRWALLHNAGEHEWRVAVGVVDSGITRTRNVHAWLERGDVAMSAIDGMTRSRQLFYLRIGVEPYSVRLINPRKIARGGPIDRRAVISLLDAWGGQWHVERDGGVIAD